MHYLWGGESNFQVEMARPWFQLIPFKATDNVKLKEYHLHKLFHRKDNKKTDQNKIHENGYLFLNIAQLLPQFPIYIFFAQNYLTFISTLKQAGN